MRRAAFTMVELLLALALMSIVMLGLVRLLDTSLDLWNETESERDVLELGSTLLELAARDLATLEGSEDGDLVHDWIRRDADGNGVADLLVPRLRLRRQADAAELARAGAGRDVDPWRVGLVEVCYVLVPAGGADADSRNVGVLYRGERPYGADDGERSFLDDEFFGAGGLPRGGVVDELSGGVLWFGVVHASPTSVLHDGWRVGDRLADCATSWDAWGRGRPSTEISDWNTAPAGMPDVEDVPVLPRRVRLELELERPQDRIRRPRLLAAADANERELRVSHPRRMPARDSFVLVGEEWLRVLATDGERVSVERGQRGTRPQTLAAGSMVHFGSRLVRDVPVNQGRGTW